MLFMSEHTSLNRLTREQFRALARDKGWKLKMLAERWGVTPEWVSIISRDPHRDIRFDDALFGLPNLRHLARDLRRRELQVEEAVAAYRASQVSKPYKPSAAGYRYHGYLTVGMIVAAATQFGTVAEEGERGMVFHIRDNHDEETYGVIFENGGIEWFPPVLVDSYLAGTGLLATGGVSYQYLDDPTLRADFARGWFDFWPTSTSMQQR